MPINDVLTLLHRTLRLPSENSMFRRSPLMTPVATRTRLRRVSPSVSALPPFTLSVHPPEEEEVQEDTSFRRSPLMTPVATRTRLRRVSPSVSALSPSTLSVHPPEEEEEVQIIRRNQCNGDFFSPIIVASSEAESDEEDTSFSDAFTNSLSSEHDVSDDSDYVPMAASGEERTVATSAFVMKRKGKAAVAPKVKAKMGPAYKRRRSSGSPINLVLIEEDADTDADDSDSWTEMDVDKPEPEMGGLYECCDISSDDDDKKSGGTEQEVDSAFDAPAEKEAETEDCGISSGDEEDTDRAKAVEVDEENESQYRILFACLNSDEGDCADATQLQEDADEALCADTANMESKRSSPNLHTKRENESRKSERRRDSHDRAKEAKRRETGKPRLSAEEGYHVVLNSVTESVNACSAEGTVDPLVAEESEIGSEDDDDKPEPSEADKEIEWLYKMLYFCLACDENDDPTGDLEDDGDASLSDSAKKHCQLCELGQHCLILEEEVGIVCKYCGFVREEIKHVIAPFHENPFGESRRSYRRHDRRYPGDVPDFDDSISDCQPDMEDANFDPAGTIWEIIPGYRSKMYRHQREAFEHIWKNVAGGTKLKDLSEHSSGSGGGCLLAHAPGSGKTCVTLAFIKTYMKYYKKARPRPLIIAPAGILLTWKEEFTKWKVGIPFVNMNENELTSEEKTMAASLPLDLSWVPDVKTRNRLIKLFIWKGNEAVLALSYNLFADFARKDKPCYEIFRRGLFELPGLLVLDEVHIGRNKSSNIHKVISGVKTKKRICLSGTPFQNNFQELYNVMCLVRPEFLTMWGKKNPFRSAVAKEDDDKIRELEEKMKPFCHSHDSSALQGRVPGLCDNIIYLQPSKLQKQLLWEVGQQKHAFGGDHVVDPICVHPFLLQNPDFAAVGKIDIAAGAKARFLMRLIELCSALEERVLVFSQFIMPLNFVKALLECEEHFGWREGREILFMSGDTNPEERERIMSLLNNPKSDVKVMLASTRACSEGISLTGASRVVLLDRTWNPAVEKQAMSRAHRMGQKKVVHVYRLIMQGIDTDISKHTSQTRKTMYSNHVFSRGSRKSVVAGSSTLGSEDVVLERLIEERIIEKAMIASDQ